MVNKAERSNRPLNRDVLFEENFINTDRSSFASDQIYEWNIDGCGEQQIFHVLHKILMYTIICKANGNSDSQIINFILAGFTGQLKGWWNNVLNEAQRNEVLNAKKLVQTPIQVPVAAGPVTMIGPSTMVQDIQTETQIKTKRYASKSPICLQI